MIDARPGRGRRFIHVGHRRHSQPEERQEPARSGRARTAARALGDHGVVREARSSTSSTTSPKTSSASRSTCSASAAATAPTTSRSRASSTSTNRQSLPQVAFLRGGTMNTVANSIGVPHGKPEGLLDRLDPRLRRARGAPARQRRAQRDAHRHDVRFPLRHRRRLRLFGRVLPRGGEPPSPLVAANTLLRGVGSALVGGEIVSRIAAPFRGWVELDDGTTWEERDYFAVAGGTIDQIGLDFKPFYRWAEQPGAFHMLGIHTWRWASSRISRASGAPSRCATARRTRRPSRARHPQQGRDDALHDRRRSARVEGPARRDHRPPREDPII